MTNEDLYKAIGDINENYIKGANKKMKANFLSNYKVWGAIAACLCVVMLGTAIFGNFSNSAPKPERVQVVNPIMEVSSVEEMSKYLDFEVPVLDKDVDTYIVMVIDGYPKSARIMYADDGIFNMKYGTGDISGIFGGKLDKEETINGVQVSFYSYSDNITDVRYALWENNGFTYSLSGGDVLEQEIASLTK